MAMSPTVMTTRTNRTIASDRWDMTCQATGATGVAVNVTGGNGVGLSRLASLTVPLLRSNKRTRPLSACRLYPHLLQLCPVETTVSDSVTVGDVAKKPVKTVPIHARLPEPDVAELDKAAAQQPIPVSRSMMVALIVRAWAEKRLGQKKK